MAPPPDGYTASVRSITTQQGGAVVVTLRLSDGSLRRVFVPAALATFEGVTWTAGAVAALVRLLEATG